MTITQIQGMLAGGDGAPSALHGLGGLALGEGRVPIGDAPAGPAAPAAPAGPAAPMPIIVQQVAELPAHDDVGSPSAEGVRDVLDRVQNVLRSELEASRRRPQPAAPTSPVAPAVPALDEQPSAPVAAAAAGDPPLGAWSVLLPAMAPSAAPANVTIVQENATSQPTTPTPSTEAEKLPNSESTAHDSSEHTAEDSDENSSEEENNEETEEESENASSEEPTRPSDPTTRIPSTVTESPITEHHSSKFTITEPPATEPPVRETFATEPPATEPPATEPPATEPLATEPLATESPTTRVPTTRLPATRPPATDPPAGAPTLFLGLLPPFPDPLDDSPTMPDDLPLIIESSAPPVTTYRPPYTPPTGTAPTDTVRSTELPEDTPATETVTEQTASEAGPQGIQTYAAVPSPEVPPATHDLHISEELADSLSSVLSQVAQHATAVAEPQRPEEDDANDTSDTSNDNAIIPQRPVNVALVELTPVQRPVSNGASDGTGHLGGHAQEDGQAQEIEDDIQKEAEDDKDNDALVKRQEEVATEEASTTTPRTSTPFKIVVEDSPIVYDDDDTFNSYTAPQTSSPIPFSTSTTTTGTPAASSTAQPTTTTSATTEPDDLRTTPSAQPSNFPEGTTSPTSVAPKDSTTRPTAVTTTSAATTTASTSAKPSSTDAASSPSAAETTTPAATTTAAPVTTTTAATTVPTTTKASTTPLETIRPTVTKTTTVPTTAPTTPKATTSAVTTTITATTTTTAGTTAGTTTTSDSKTTSPPASSQPSPSSPPFDLTAAATGRPTTQSEPAPETTPSTKLLPPENLNMGSDKEGTDVVNNSQDDEDGQAHKGTSPLEADESPAGKTEPPQNTYDTRYEETFLTDTPTVPFTNGGTTASDENEPASTEQTTAKPGEDSTEGLDKTTNSGESPSTKNEEKTTEASKTTEAATSPQTTQIKEETAAPTQALLTEAAETTVPSVTTSKQPETVFPVFKPPTTEAPVVETEGPTETVFPVFKGHSTPAATTPTTSTSSSSTLDSSTPSASTPALSTRVSSTSDSSTPVSSTPGFSTPDSSTPTTSTKPSSSIPPSSTTESVTHSSTTSSTSEQSTPPSTQSTSSTPELSTPTSSTPSSSAPTSSTSESSTTISKTAPSSTPESSSPGSSTPSSSTTASRTESSTTTSSTTASSTMESSTPTSSTPSSSTPVSSTPTSSTPASSTSTASTPASSTPASSTPASSTPASSTPTSSTPASSTPASSTPASSTPASSTTSSSLETPEPETEDTPESTEQTQQADGTSPSSGPSTKSPTSTTVSESAIPSSATTLGSTPLDKDTSPEPLPLLDDDSVVMEPAAGDTPPALPTYGPTSSPIDRLEGSSSSPILTKLATGPLPAASDGSSESAGVVLIPRPPSAPAVPVFQARPGDSAVPAGPAGAAGPAFPARPGTRPDQVLVPVLPFHPAPAQGHPLLSFQQTQPEKQSQPQFFANGQAPEVVPAHIHVHRPPRPQRPADEPLPLGPPQPLGLGLEASTVSLGSDVRRFAGLCNELAFRMWSAVAARGLHSGRSVVLSPLGVTSTLAMVFLGARGPTSGQMNEVLRLDDMVTFNPHQVFRNVTESVVLGRHPGIAAAAFVRQLYSDRSKGRLLDFYKERAQQFYDAHVEEVDFSAIGDVVRRRTNLLVKRQTRGRVPEYLRGAHVALQPPLAAFGANIFQTECSAASLEGRDGEMYFTVLPETRQRRLVLVPAAVWRDSFLAGYDPVLDCTVSAIGDASSLTSVVLVLPGRAGAGPSASAGGLSALERRLAEPALRRDAWSRLLRSLAPRPGMELQVPRFSHRSLLNATSALQRMGLRDLFSAERADLRGLNGVANDLHLSDIVQVNTFSTCADGGAGAMRQHSEEYPAGRRGRGDLSGIPLALRPRQGRDPAQQLQQAPRLRYDRPFLYFVRHNPTGFLLHMGRFNPHLLH